MTPSSPSTRFAIALLLALGSAHCGGRGPGDASDSASTDGWLVDATDAARWDGSTPSDAADLNQPDAPSADVAKDVASADGDGGVSDAGALDVTEADADAGDAAAMEASVADADGSAADVVDASAMDTGDGAAGGDASADAGVGDAASDASASDGTTGDASASDAGGPSLRANAFGISATNGVATGVVVDHADRVTVVGDVTGDANFGGGTALAINGSGDGFVVSYAADGSFRWLRRLGASSPAPAATSAFDVAVDADDNVYVIGLNQGAVPFGSTFLPGGMFLVSYDANGALRWAEQLTNTLPGTGRVRLAIDGDTIVAVLGNNSATTIGTHLWPATSTILVATARRSDGAITGSFAIASGPGSQSPGALAVRAGVVDLGVTDATQTAIVTLDETGTELTRTPTASDRDLSGLVARSDGTLAVAGAHLGGLDVPAGATSSSYMNVFLRVAPPAGAASWSWTLPSSMSWSVVPSPALATGPGGNLYLVAPFKGHLVTGAGTYTVTMYTHNFVVAYSPDGTAIWAAAFVSSGTNSEFVQDTAVDSLGRVYIVGQYFGRGDFGDGPLPFSSPGGVLVMRYTR